MLQLLLSGWLTLFHPFFVSVTEINHNARSKSVEISCRMFYDDLEKALERNYHTKIDIVKPANREQVNKLLNDYIKKHLIIRADGKVLDASFLGYEIQEDGAWSYLEVRGVSNMKKIEVRDNLLYAEHPEQINMIHVIVGGNRKSTKLDNPDTDAIFSF
jgi:hypothetical protein